MSSITVKWTKILQHKVKISPEIKTESYFIWQGIYMLNKSTTHDHTHKNYKPPIFWFIRAKQKQIINDKYTFFCFNKGEKYSKNKWNRWFLKTYIWNVLIICSLIWLESAQNLKDITESHVHLFMPLLFISW